MEDLLSTSDLVQIRHRAGAAIRRDQHPGAASNSLRDAMPLSAASPAGREPPRALRSLGRIIQSDLCHRCGTCVGICPTSALGVDREGYPIVQELSMCTDCDLCVRVCPGDEFDMHSVMRTMFGRILPLEDIHGQFDSAYLAYATDQALRSASASGGALSAMLVSLLESGVIDGALLVRPHTEQKHAGEAFIARTKAEILAARGSKYAITPTNVAFHEIANVPGRYAIVGLPCQIHGFHNAAKLDRRLKERVVLTVGLLCHAVIEHEPVETVMNRLTAAEGNVASFVYRDGKPSGTPLATMTTGERLPAFFPRAARYQPTTIEILNVFYRMYTPLRCLTCADATAELADVVFGDPWMPAPSAEIDFKDGFTYTLVRTKRGASAIEEAVRTAAVSLYRLTEDQARSSNVTMGREKKSRAFRLLASRATAGLPTPNYHLPSSFPAQKRQLRVELHLLSHWFCFRTGMRSVATKILLSRLGYLFFLLNGLRRSLRRYRDARL